MEVDLIEHITSKTNMNVIANKKYFLGVSALLVLVAIVIVAIKGITYSIEFTGGSLLEVSYETRPSLEQITTAIASTGIEAQIQPLGETNYVIKTGPLDEGKHQALTTATTDGSIERFTSIGPSVGKELRTKALWAIILVSLAIIFFVAYAFRQVTEPVSSWKYGVVAVIALIHDLIIPVGVMTFLATPIDTLYVVGLLSILGISVNDTIVVFDRIRENLKFNHDKKIDEPFDTTINEAINQTLIRSLFTSLSLIIVLVVLYVAGPESTKTLSLVLLLGTAVGTYSSIFVASPILTYLLPKKTVERK